jgi:GDP-D-mannose dehydratase
MTQYKSYSAETGNMILANHKEMLRVAQITGIKMTEECCKIQKDQTRRLLLS